MLEADLMKALELRNAITRLEEELENIEHAELSLMCHRTEPGYQLISASYGIPEHQLQETVQSYLFNKLRARITAKREQMTALLVKVSGEETITRADIVSSVNTRLGVETPEQLESRS